MDVTATTFANISFTNIISSLLAVEKLVTAAAYLIGISFAIKALYSMRRLAESRSAQHEASAKEPLLYMLVAGMLLYFPSGFAALMQTTFGYSEVLAYGSVDSRSSALNAVFGEDSAFGYALSLIIQVVGVIAFVRGWTLIAKSASSGQSGGTGQGLVHVFGGILAMNIMGTIQMLMNTIFGG